MLVFHTLIFIGVLTSMALCSVEEKALLQSPGVQGQVMSNWMPIHLWEVIYRNEKEMTENYNQDYFDSANHCFQKLIGEHEYTPNTTHYPKVIASMTALMHCVVTINVMHTPYNTYQDLEEDITTIWTGNPETKFLSLLKLPFIIVWSLIMQPLRTVRQLGAIVVSTIAYMMFAEA